MILHRIITALEKHATPKTVVALVMVVIPFNALLFPIISDRLKALSGYGLLDTLFTYSPSEVFNRLQAYGYEGRLFYLITSWSVDFIYPLLYTALFACLLTLFLNRSFAPGNLLIRLQLLPFGMMVFDYCENAAIAFLLAFYPSKPVIIALMASVFTSLKWCFAALTFIALLVAIAGLLLALSRGSKIKGKAE